MWKSKFRYVAIILVLLSFLLGCAGPREAEQELDSVVLLPQLNFELEDFIGKKISALGFYGDARFTGDGVSFLVLDFYRLIVDEKLPNDSFARLDGDLPTYDMNGAELLVYGEVKDFGQTYNVYTILPTPLITVERYHIVTPPQEVGGGTQNLSSLFAGLSLSPATTVLAQGAVATGTEAKDCDRALIISGGVDANNNYVRYKDNIVGKYKKLKELGFTDNQTGVLYNDGSALNVTGTNIVDDKASKQNIKDILEKHKDEMEASCTLTIFVTDHGTGYNEGQGYHGARPAFCGETGKTYPENQFKIDLKRKVYKDSVWTNPNGEVWWVHIDKETNKLQLYKKEGGQWVLKGEDSDGDGRVTEAETGQDIDGDGDTDDVGWSAAALGAWQHRNNEWDTDGDGTSDVRARWDGTKYVVERLKDGEWKKMGEDTNDDHVIDNADGGIDWNLDGDTNDQMGFHEGINLWGDEVLWDDEFAEMVKPLHDKGIHIVIEMAQCFAGGFIENLKGIVDKIVTFSGEDTKHWNRDDGHGGYYAADEKAFVDNLSGIDLESWNEAFDKAKEADRQRWEAEGSKPGEENDYEKWEKPLIETESTFREKNGEYRLRLKIPEDLKDKVYDIEISFGLQKPRWDKGEVLQLPEGFSEEEIAGGIKIKSTNPFPLTILEFKLRGATNAESIRIHITDKEHRNLGYIMPEKLPWPVYTRSAEIRDWAEILGLYTGTEDYIDGITVQIPRSDYIEFMISRLNVYLGSTDPSITEEMKEGIEKLVEFLDEASYSDCQWAADIYMDSYFEAQKAAMPPSDVLLVSFAAGAESVRDESGCRSTLMISFDGRDLTDGDCLVTQVIVEVNGELWHDSGTVSTVHYQNSVGGQVGCGETFNIEVIATNEKGQTATSTGSITTPVPELGL